MFPTDAYSAELARDVISELAPQELPLFRATSEAFQKDPDKTLKENEPKDEMLGFGQGEVIALLTPVVLAVTKEILEYVSGELQKLFEEDGIQKIKNFFDALFKSSDTEELDEEEILDFIFTREQLDQIRHIAFGRATELKLSERTANALADSIVARLVPLTD